MDAALLAVISSCRVQHRPAVVQISSCERSKTTAFLPFERALVISCEHAHAVCQAPSRSKLRQAIFRRIDFKKGVTHRIGMIDFIYMHQSYTSYTYELATGLSTN